MKSLNILLWINIILIAFLAIFCFRVYFKKYLDTNNKLITFLLIISTFICGFACIDALLSCHTYSVEITFVQDFYGKYECNANFINTLITKRISHIQKATFLAYLFFLISIICRKLTVYKNKTSLAKQKNRLWDWNKILKSSH